MEGTRAITIELQAARHRKKELAANFVSGTGATLRQKFDISTFGRPWATTTIVDRLAGDLYRWIRQFGRF